MKALVTGAAGFIGSHITERLLREGAVVVGCDNFINGRRENIDAIKDAVGPRLAKNFYFFETDISHFGNLKSLIDAKASSRTGRFTHICHQAALGSVPRSFKNPSKTMRHGPGAFINVLECARIFEIGRVVYASSSSVYGDDLSETKTESRTGGPLSPYALSKQFCEGLGEMYAKAFGLRIMGLRYFNVFGPRQLPEGPYAAVIPKWVETLKSGGPIEIFGNGEQARDFTYVKNVVEANWLALNSVHPGHHALNIACGASTSLNQMLSILMRLTGRDPADVSVNIRKERVGDIKNSRADISFAKMMIGYEPLYSLEDGLRDMFSGGPGQRLAS